MAAEGAAGAHSPEHASRCLPGSAWAGRGVRRVRPAREENCALPPRGAASAAQAGPGVGARPPPGLSPLLRRGVPPSLPPVSQQAGRQSPCVTRCTRRRLA